MTSGPRTGTEFPLDSLIDFGFLSIGNGTFAIGRLFLAPDGTRLLADAQSFEGPPDTAFERLWHGHFRRNFFLVGMEETEFHATADLRESVFSACEERSVRLSAPNATAHNLQIGHFEETPDGLRRVLPRGRAPRVPALIIRPVSLPITLDGLARLRRAEAIPHEHLSLSSFPASVEFGRMLSGIFDVSKP